MFPTPRSAAGSTFHSVGPTAVPCVAELSVPLGNDGCGIFSPPKLLRSNIIEIYIPAWSYYLRVSSVGVEAASVTTTSCCNASNQLPRLQYTFSCRPCLLSLSPFSFFSSPFSSPPHFTFLPVQTASIYKCYLSLQRGPINGQAIVHGYLLQSLTIPLRLLYLLSLPHTFPPTHP